MNPSAENGEAFGRKIKPPPVQEVGVVDCIVPSGITGPSKLPFSIVAQMPELAAANEVRIDAMNLSIVFILVDEFR